MGHGLENSLDAIRAAARLRADAVELDVRIRQGTLVCAHDRGQDGPPLQRALDLALDLGLRVELDMKESGRRPLSALAEHLDQAGAHERAWVSTFHPLAAWRLRHLDPRLVVGWSIARSWAERLPLWSGWPQWLGLQVIEPEVGLLTPERRALWQGQGLVVETWCVPLPHARHYLDDDVRVVLDTLE